MLVDQRRAGGGQPGELGGDVVHLERHVVQARPAALEEPADRRVRARRLQELDPTGADPQRRRLDPLLVQPLAMLEDGAAQMLIAADRLVEIVDGNADVMDAPGVDDAERYPEVSAPRARTTPTASEESESGVTPANTLIRSSRASVSCSSSAPAIRSRATRCLPSRRIASP